MNSNTLDEQSWIVFYNRIKTDYQGKRKFSAIINSNDGKELLDRIMILEKSLNVMKESPMEYDLSASEIARRQLVMENLRKQINTSMVGDTKALLTPMNVTSNPNNDNSGSFNSNNANNANTINPLMSSDRALIQRQRDVMAMQDDMLVDIEKGVDRLHNKAKVINQEAIIQNKILDELDTHVDQATEGLREETKHAEQIKRKTQMCYMYLCLVVELIIIVVLCVIFFLHK